MTNITTLTISRRSRVSRPRDQDQQRPRGPCGRKAHPWVSANVGKVEDHIRGDSGGHNLKVKLISQATESCWAHQRRVVRGTSLRGIAKCGAVWAETFSKDGLFGRLGTDNWRRKPESLQVVLALGDIGGMGRTVGDIPWAATDFDL